MVKIMTAQEAAEFLRIKSDTLYSLIEKDNLPASKIGNQWRFIEDDLVNWLRSKTRSTAISAKDECCGEEKALAEIHQKFMDATFDAVFLSRNRRIIECNDITLDLYGYNKEQLIGEPTTKLFATQFHDGASWAKTADRTGILQTVCLRADGTAFPVEISVKTVFYDQHITRDQKCLRITAVRNIADFGQQYWTDKVRSVLREYKVQSMSPGIASDIRPEH